MRWRSRPGRGISATHWQGWLQADAQRDAGQGLGPAPGTRALDVSAPGRALAPHTVPLANLPFDPVPEGAIQKSVPLPPARGATEPTICPLCADKYYTSGARLEHLAWHAVHAAAPVEDKEAASHILQIAVACPVRPAPPTPGGRTRGSPGGRGGGAKSGHGNRVRCRPYPASKDDMAEITRQIKECVEADLVYEYKNTDYFKH